tara:strand:- start:1327 stop:2370 length:1044 start_codon:yes stop_codon:yes gene_type:complete
MATINFSGTNETVVLRNEFTLEMSQVKLKNKTISIIGYGVQGPSQALNLKDNGFNVIVGQRKGTKSWEKALKDNWKEGFDLFDIETACSKSEIIMYLLSDAGQIACWNTIKPFLTKGKTLYFSHGFGMTYNEQTGIVPPKDVNVVMVAPKGSGTSLRRLFKKGEGINSSYAIYNDFTGDAKDIALSLGIGIGSGYLFETDFKKEVYSDLTGERGILMGALAGMFEAQYDVLRKNGHSPSEAFNETVEELTQSLMPLVAENGMDWMYSNTSVTAQRGALDWKNKFKLAALPVFDELYESVSSGKEAKRVIAESSKPDYRENLENELKEIRESELWKTGSVVRELRAKQ